MKRILTLILALLLLTACAVTDTAPAPTPTAAPTAAPTPAPTPTPLPEGSSIAVHFIDVGQGDAALIVCDGQTMLIDGGEPSASDIIYTYLKKHGVTYLDCVVASHAHEDHVGGLSGALSYAKAGAVLCPVTEYDSRAFRSLVKKTEAQGLPITVPSAGDSFPLGGATVTILSCDSRASNPNNSSIFLRIDHGETSFLFTGDGEYEAEKAVQEKGLPLKTTVLKVGHHGSDSSTCYSFLYETNPQYAVISVGAGNQYGHPTQEVLSRLRDAEVTVYRTDQMGDIIVTGDGRTLTFQTERPVPPQ